jgi:hypothetical protein
LVLEAVPIVTFPVLDISEFMSSPFTPHASPSAVPPVLVVETQVLPSKKYKKLVLSTKMRLPCIGFAILFMSLVFGNECTFINSCVMGFWAIHEKEINIKKMVFIMALVFNRLLLLNERLEKNQGDFLFVIDFQPL